MNPYAILGGAILAAAAIGGAYVQGRSDGARIERQKVAVQQNQQLADALRRAGEAEQKADAEARRSAALARQIAERRTEIVFVEKEVARDISKVTTGRNCLDAAAVRLLNKPAHGEPAGKAPEAGGTGPAEPDTGGFATDTDVAAWANEARSAYRQCAVERNTWVRWYDGYEPSP